MGRGNFPKYLSPLARGSGDGSGYAERKLGLNNLGSVYKIRNTCCSLSLSLPLRSGGQRQQIRQSRGEGKLSKLVCFSSSFLPWPPSDAFDVSPRRQTNLAVVKFAPPQSLSSTYITCTKILLSNIPSVFSRLVLYSILSTHVAPF